MWNVQNNNKTTLVMCSIKPELKNSVKMIHDFKFFNSLNPGLYEIYCKVNKKSYIGEASNVLDRIAKHGRNLLTNLSKCSELQKDWNKYGPEQFAARVLLIGPAWSDVSIRKKKDEIIRSYKPEKVYNVHSIRIVTKQKTYRVRCKIHGVIYENIAEASRQTGESETRIRTKLQKNYEGSEILEQIDYGYEHINGNRYESINQAVNADEATNCFAAMRLLRYKKRKDWNYLFASKVIEK